MMIIPKTVNSIRSRGIQRTLLAALFLMLSGLALRSSGFKFMVAEPGTLKLSILDDVSGQPTPARVELLDQEGSGYVAADALPVGGDCMDRGMPMQETLDQALAVLSKKVTNPYTKTTQFYSTGNSEISLPPGKYQLKILKGIEYRVHVQEVQIETGKTAHASVKMARWIRLPERGWYSADDHLHIARPIRELNPYISKMMQAEDIHVANLLQIGLSKRFQDSRQYAHGPDGVYREGDYILAAGQENPRTHFLGHTITLGVRSPINFPEQYLIYRLFWEEARRQGALVGYAHYGEAFGAQSGLAIDLPHRLLSFVEVLQFNQGRYDVWYDALNTGFRLTPTAGTDYPCLGTNLPGRERFYTEVKGPFTHESWLEGVRRGRTFVTNGPILVFRVNGKGIGQEVLLEKPGSVLVEGSVHFDPVRDDVGELEVIQNGRLLATFSRRSGESGQISCQFQYEVRETSWFALRAAGGKEGETFPFPPPPFFRSLAHSAPIYVTLKPTPGLLAQPRTKALARAWIARLEDLERRLAEDQLEYLASQEGFKDGVDLESLRKNRPALIEAIQAAKKYYEGIDR